jgi:hypothetical protein
MDGSATGLPGFTLYRIPKLEKCTKLPQNIQSDRKMLDLAIKYTIIFHSKAFKNVPKMGILGC